MVWCSPSSATRSGCRSAATRPSVELDVPKSRPQARVMRSVRKMGTALLRAQVKSGNPASSGFGALFVHAAIVDDFEPPDAAALRLFHRLSGAAQYRAIERAHGIDHAEAHAQRH